MDCGDDMDLVVPEVTFIPDYAKLLADLIWNEWSLGPENIPTVTYEVESEMVSARLGNIHVYQMTGSSAQASIDYRNVNLTAYVGIKVSTRFRETYYEWVNEVYRILYAYRRAGPRKLKGMMFLDIINLKPQNDLSGWYAGTFDVRLVSHSRPIISAGFGTDLNKQIYLREQQEKVPSEGNLAHRPIGPSDEEV